MKKYILGGLICLISTYSLGQTITYKFPETIRTPQASLTFEKIQASGSSYHINYKAKNIGDGVLVIDRSQTSLIQNGSEIHTTSESYVLKAGDSKTVYNQFRVKSPGKANAQELELSLHGIQYAVSNGLSLEAEKLTLAESATQTIGDFSVKVMEYKVYSDRIYTEVKCTYNGGGNRLGKIDLTSLTVEGGKAEVVRKGDLVFSGKSYSFSINITPEAPEYKLDWNGVFEVMNLVDIQIDKIAIKSTSFKETPAVETTNTTTNNPGTAATTECALSYDEFNKLKSDLVSEVGSGGKPVALAGEYLSVKGCINTAQVVELMGTFNLDAPRLEFAKKAYQYTSDKHKYHLVVKTLSYNNNKQALEEFIGQQ